MSITPGPLSFALQQSMRFIDFLLAQYGTINRSALMDYFGISVVQASADLQRYLVLAPGNLEYDKHSKVYKRTDQFKRVWL